MNEHQTTKIELQDETLHDDDSSPALPSSIDVNILIKLHADNDEEALRDQLEEVAYDYIYENPDWKGALEENISVIRSKTATQQAKRAAAADNRALNSRAQQIILDQAGIHDVIVDEIEHTRHQISQLVAKYKAENGETADPLLALGILQRDKDGKDRFAYPRGLFPPSTTKKWHAYIRAVKEHIEAADLLEKGGARGVQGFVVEKDRARRAAHNAVSRDAQKLLGFADTDDGFEEARRLMAKMRENRFPTVETGEQSRIARQIGGSVLALLRNTSQQFYDPEGANNS